jgi:hypothetical protein
MSTVIPALQASSIKHCMFIDLDVNGVSYYLSNAYAPLTYNGNTYTQLGYLLNVSEFQGDLKITNNAISISLSGLPTDDGSPSYMAIALNSKLKGSKITIYRAFFDISNGFYDPTQVYQRFNGYVSNFSLSENWDQENKLTSNTISLQCSSTLAILEKKFSGRRTNEADQQFWYPTDTGMYRIKALADSQFDFGKPYVAPASATAAAPADTGGGF